MNQKQTKVIFSVILAAIFLFAFIPVNTQAAVKKIVKSVSVNKTSVTLQDGLKANVSATVNTIKKTSASDMKVTVKSSNKKIADVKVSKAPSKKAKSGTSTIQISAKSKGTAKITVTTVKGNNKGKKLSKTINVNVLPTISSLSLSKTSVSMETEKTENISATVKASKTLSAVDLKVTVKSSNSSVASVKVSKNPTKSGKSGVSTIQISGKAAGTAKITVSTVKTASNGKKLVKTITVNVKKIPATTSTPTTEEKVDPDPTTPITPSTPSEVVKWTVSSETYMGAKAFRDPETGRQDSIPKQLTRKYVSFNPWPTTKEQVEYVIKNCDDPYVVGALYIVALDNFTCKGPGDYSGVTFAMVDSLMNGAGTVSGDAYHLSNYAKQRLSDFRNSAIYTTDGRTVKTSTFASRAYLKGATPENNYTPDGGMKDKTKWKIVMDTYVYCGDLSNGYITVCPQRYSLEQATDGGEKVYVQHWQGLRIGFRLHTTTNRWLPTKCSALNLPTGTKPTGPLEPFDISSWSLFSNNYVAPVEDQGF